MIENHQRGKLLATPSGQPMDGLLLRVVDGALAGCIFVLPLVMGGRQPLGQLVLVALALAAALAWVVRQVYRGEAHWRRSAGDLLLAAGVVLVLVQLVPLPEAVLGKLAPRTTELLPLWGSGAEGPGAMGTWSQISLFPAATRSGMVLFLAYAMLFWVTVQRVRGLEDVERLLSWCAVSAVIMASFGLVQYLAGNGKFFWVYEHPFSNTSNVVKGSFTNRNHFAHFLALGLGPLIWWVGRGLGSRREKPRKETFGGGAASGLRIDPGRGVWILALGVVLFAGLLSLSRGGAAAMLLAACVAVAVAYRAKAIGGRFVLGLGGTAVLIAAALAIFGYDRVSQRLDDFAAGSIDALDRSQTRRTIWATTAEAVPEFAIAGSGVGTFREVFPMYRQTKDAAVYYTHAENGYLQVLLETGAGGLLLVLAGIGIVAVWCVTGLRRGSSARLKVCVGAVAAGLAASAVHSLVDYVWYVPACSALVAILAACACRLAQLSWGESARPGRPVALPAGASLGAAVVLVGLAAWMLHDRVGPVAAASHWQRARLLSQTLDQPEPAEEAPAGEAPEDDATGPAPSGDAATALNEPNGSVLGSSTVRVSGPPGPSDAPSASPPPFSTATEEALVDELKAVVRVNPDDGEAHLQLAEAYLRLFHRRQAVSANQMSLRDICDAAIQSRKEFSTDDAYKLWLAEWLPKAVGQHFGLLRLAARHARRGLAICPLKGEGYLYLGELTFLDGGTRDTWSAYVAQALRVRPHSGTVLFHAGTQALMSGNQEEWLRCWRRAFQSGRVYQRDLIDQLVGRAGPEGAAEEIQFILRTFEPDLEALRYLTKSYRGKAPPERVAELWLAHARAAEAEAAGSRGGEASSLWLEATTLYEEMSQPARALECAGRAVEADPNSYRARYALGFRLADGGYLAEAERHLSWCAQRRPQHRMVQRKLQEVARRKLRAGNTTAAAGGTGGPMR